MEWWSGPLCACGWVIYSVDDVDVCEVVAQLV